MNVPVKASFSPLMDPESFNHMQRVGKLLAASPLFPEHLRKGGTETAAANGVLVMNMAVRLQEDPLAVAQNIYFVSGKPGWSASYMISKANQSGKFKNPIEFKTTGQGDDLKVEAFAEMANTGRKVSASVSMEMARAEGWTKNAKYKTMPEQMLRYRSATFLIRLYCPEVMVGLPSQVEIETEQKMKDVSPADYADSKTVTVEESMIKPEDAVEVAEDAVEVPETDVQKEAKVDEPKEAAKDQPNFEAIKQSILNDLTDSGNVDAVTTFYEEQIEAMRVEAPEIHKQLTEELAAFSEIEDPSPDAQQSAPSGIN